MGVGFEIVLNTGEYVVPALTSSCISCSEKSASILKYKSTNELLAFDGIDRSAQRLYVYTMNEMFLFCCGFHDSHLLFRFRQNLRLDLRIRPTAQYRA